MLSKSDPYLKVSLGGKDQKTVSKKGSSPVWETTFTFAYANEPSLKLALWDKDLLRDDFLAVTDVALLPLLMLPNRTFHGEVSLSRKNGKSAGYVRVTIEFHPKPDASETKIAPAAASAATTAAPPYGNYPPQQGYLQAYPPQGYPPQAYPPQAQAYPPQGYPPQGYTPQGYPPQQQQFYPPPPGYGWQPPYSAMPPQGQYYPGYFPQGGGQHQPQGAYPQAPPTAYPPPPYGPNGGPQQQGPPSQQQSADCPQRWPAPPPAHY